MKAISVRQPWAWLLIHGTKDIENREWRYLPTYRGELAIHAAQGMTRQEYNICQWFVRKFDPKLADCIPSPSELVRGAVIGTMTMRGAVRESKSPWFTGPIGLVLECPQSCDPIPAKGALGLWDWEVLDRSGRIS